MQELTLTTPSLLFSAVSLILLAYTNRFISYASLVRTLKEKHQQTHDPKDIAQIANLRKRLYLTRSMQILGLLSLLFCVVSMFFIYISWQIIAAWIFGIGLLLLAASLCVCIWEINISVNALEIHLQDMSSKLMLNTTNPKLFSFKYFVSLKRTSIFALAIGKSTIPES